MAFSITVEDARNAAPPFQQFKLSLASERLTIAELIERRVKRDIELRTTSNIPLAPINDLDRQLNRNGIDSDEYEQQRAIKNALDGFSAGHFLLFIGDVQIDELDESVVLTPTTVVQFLRLIALQGG